ncbi:MAG: MOSC domain-containing protein [Planctomycetaceae bacterium]|nr:MOSC domain-containing protein [Planctomycetaceae bacterium]
MADPVLRSIQVSLPREFGTAGAEDPMDRPWTSGFDKRPVEGPVRVGFTGLEGDGQADTVNHGGPDKAVLGYSADHYDAWRRELQKPDLPHGAFGENFTIAGLTEADICLGDIWQVGEATLQVSQPRQPCWKLARRWRIKTLSLQVQESGRTGWYFRVLKEGVVVAGIPLHRIERPYPAWTVARANHVMHDEKDDMPLAAELAAVPPLAESWKSTLRRRVEQHAHPDIAKRLLGPNDS